MGKSVNTNDKFSFKPEYNDQVKGATPTTEAAADAFSFRPEYNADVKKKIGGTESEIGITEPSRIASELQSRKETATEFLISDINKNDFFSELAANTDRYFPQTTPRRVNEQAAEMTQQEVFRNPGSLRRYSEKRINTLNEQLKDLEREKSQNKKDIEIATEGGSMDDLVKLHDRRRELSAQEREVNSYIKNLKNNIAEVASDLIVSQQDLTKADPRQIGREIIRIADPDLEAKFQLAETGGKTLPGIYRGELEAMGLNAIKSHLSRNPNIPNYDLIVDSINKAEGDFDERNYEATAQRVREKIGAQLYKEGKSAWLGFGYKPSTLEAIAAKEETGLTPSEKKVFHQYVLPIEKRIIGSDIPTSGFTRSVYNALERGGISMGKTIGDITGFRDESDQAQDLLSKEISDSRYRPVGTNPSAQAELAYLSEKEKTEQLTEKEKKKKIELENYTYVRNGWSKFKDGVGDLTGQVAMIALVTRGAGAAGRALVASGEAGGLLGGLTRSTVGQALSNETVGLFLSSYLNAYDNYKQQAIDIMPGKDQAANREAFATTMSAVEALSERIFRDTKVLDAFTASVAPSIRGITDKLISREITQQVAKEEAQKALTTSLKSFAKEYGKSTFQESTEEAVVDVANGIASSVFGGQDFDVIKTGQEAVNTFLTTALYSPVVAGMAAAGSARRNASQSAFLKSAIVDMALNPTQYLKSVEDLQMDGTITQQQANEKIALINSAHQYLKEIPSSRIVESTTGSGDDKRVTAEEVPFDYPQRASYLIHRLNEGILNEEIKNTSDEVVKAQLQKQLKRSEAIRKGIFDGSISVTPDLREVVNNPEEANELDIFDVSQIRPDELVGTSFERGTENVPRETRETTENQVKNEEESQDKTATPPAAEGEAVAAENQAAQAAKISEEQKAEIDTLVNIAREAGWMTPVYEAMAKENPEGFMKFVADQSFGRTEEGELHGLGNTEPQMRDQFGDEIVDYAKQLYPLNKIDQKDNAAQKGKVLADKIRSLKIKNDSAKSDIFGIGSTVFNGAIEVVATTIEQGARLVNAINSGIKYIREKSGKNVDEKAIREFLKDVMIEQGGDKGVYRRGEDVEVEERKYRNGYDEITIAIDGVGEIILGKEQHEANHRVDYIQVHKPLRGKGMAKRLYYEAINLLNERGLFLEPGGYSAPEALSIWRRLEKEGLATIDSVVEGGEEPGHFIIKGRTTGKSPIADKSLSGRAKALADKIRSLKTKRDKAQANIFGIGIGIYDGAIETIATAIEQGAALVDAINRGIQYIRDNGGDKLDESGFRQHIEDQASGKKPKVRVGVGEEETEEKEKPRPKKERREAQPEDADSGILDYRMTSSGEINRFLSGATWSDVFGEAPEGNQQYETQKLADMLQDGQNMIAIAQRKWGGDVMMYAKPLFQFIQSLSDGESTNKKAVLLAVLLGELQEAKLRSPERFDAIQQIERAVFSYYQSFMNQRGKEIVAGRLLRLYRDKYLGDIYADKILDEDQARAKKKIQAIEENKSISDSVAAEGVNSVTAEEKKKEDSEAKKKTDKAKKDRGKKPKMSTTEAQKKADDKLKDIEDRLGKEGKSGLVDKIKEAIKKLNCK